METSCTHMNMIAAVEPESLDAWREATDGFIFASA
jgi:hypothetical protein